MSDFLDNYRYAFDYPCGTTRSPALLLEKLCDLRQVIHFFIYENGERFGPFMLCRLVISSLMVLNQLTLMLWFKLKTSRIPPLPVHTTSS